MAFLKDLFKADILLSELFLNKEKPNLNSDQIKIYQFYIEKYYSNVEKSITAFEELIELQNEWIMNTALLASKKNKKLSASYNEICLLNEKIERFSLSWKHSPLKNPVHGHLLVFLLTNLQTFETRALIENTKMSHQDEQVISSGFEFGSLYSRDSFCKSVVSDLQKWFVIFANTHGLQITTVDLSHAIGHFILFLEDKNFLITNSKNIRERGKDKKKSAKYSYAVSYGARNLSHGPRTEFPYILPDFSLNEPILLINLCYNSETYYKGMGLLVGDWLFGPVFTYSPNFSYGFLKNISSLTSRGVESREVRSTAKIDLTDPSTQVYKSILIKEKSTPVFIDKEEFMKKSNDFVLDKLKNSNLSLESDATEIEEVLKLYSVAQNPTILKIVSNCLVLAHLKFFKEMTAKTDKVYFLFKRDGRLRKYFISLVGPTNFKYSRFYLFYGYYTKKQLTSLIKKSLRTKVIQFLPKIRLSPDFGFHHSFFSNTELAPKMTSDCLIYKNAIALSFLIAIGQQFKSILLSSSSTGYSISMEEFFQKGLEEFKKYNEDARLYEEVHKFDERDDQYKLFFYLKGLKNGLDWFKMMPIGLDFSCSGHQLRYLHRSLKDDISYDYLNLRGGDKFTDMYSLILVSFKNKIKTDPDFIKNLNDFKENKSQTPPKVINEELYKLMTRKTLKKSLMTKEYNSTFLTFLGYFEKQIREGDSYEFYKKHREDYLYVLKLLFNFVNDLDGKIPKFNVDRLDACDDKTIPALLSGIGVCHGYRFFTWDGCELGFAIFKKATRKERIYYNSQINKHKGKSTRITAQLNFYSDTVDKASTDRAFLPNFIHHLDGTLVRMVIYYSNQSYAYMSIHDEYLIPFQEIFIFKDLINNVIKLDPFKKPKRSGSARLADHDVSSEKIKVFCSYFVIS